MNTENTELKFKLGLSERNLVLNFEFSARVATPFITNANNHSTEIKKKRSKEWEEKRSIYKLFGASSIFLAPFLGKPA